MSEPKETAYPCLLMDILKDEAPSWTNPDQIMQRALITCSWRYCYWYHNQVGMVKSTEAELDGEVAKSFSKCLFNIRKKR